MIAFWHFGLVGVLAVALATDLAERKIFNWLTFPAIGLGLALNAWAYGPAGLQGSLLGLLVGAAVFLLGFLVGGMGAGDVKLMAAVGAWLGWPATVAAVLYVTMLGGAVALVAAAANGQLSRLFKNVYWFVVGLVVKGASTDMSRMESAAKPVPYGVSIALGSALALFFPEVNDLWNALH